MDSIVTIEKHGPCYFTSIGRFVIRVEDDERRSRGDAEAIREIIATEVAAAVLVEREACAEVAELTPTYGDAPSVPFVIAHHIRARK
jgi:hypothetical protein